MEHQASYDTWSLYRRHVVTRFVLFALLAGGMLVVAKSGAGVDDLYALPVVAVLVWKTFRFLSGVAYRLDLDGTVLRWRALLRSGDVPLSEIAALRPFKSGSPMEVIEMLDGSSISVFAREGLTTFTDALASVRPDLPVRVDPVH